MTIQALINKIFRANQTQNNTVSWSGSNGLKSIQEDIVSTLRERTFFTVPTTAALANQGFNNAILCYVQDEAFYRWSATGIPNGTTIFPANDGGVWVQETIGQTDGTVTSIGITAPAAFTVTNSPVTTSGVIDIAANGTASEYIKGDGTLGTLPTPTGGTVTSVSALTINSTGTDLSSTVANPTTTPVITLSVPTASALNRGVLSSADWTAFNSKQNAITLTTTGTSGAATLVGATLNIPQYQSVITNPVTGTGTTNYHAKWTSSSTLNNSLIYDDGTNVGISTASPSYKLDVNGTGRFQSSLLVTNGSTNSINHNPGSLRITIGQSGSFFNHFQSPGAGTFQFINDNTSTEVCRITNGKQVYTNQILNGFDFTTTLNITGNRYGISTTLPAIEFNTFNNSGSGYNAIRMRLFNGDSGKIVMQEVSGNVLIGTATDGGQKLQVVGDTKITGATSAGNYSLSVYNSSNTLSFYVRGFGDALLAGTLFLSTQNGPNFISNGTLGITSSQGAGNQFVRFTHNNGNNAFRILTNSVIELNPVAGNVLIGTTTDAGYKLDVNGTLRVQGTLALNNGNTYISNTSNNIWIAAVNSTANDVVVIPGRQLNVNSTGTYTAQSSAIAQIDSTTKGFLQPRMTTTQRDAIATPATGLSIYNTTTNTEDYYNGTAWVSLQTSAAAVKSFGAWQHDVTQTAAVNNTGYGVRFDTADISGQGIAIQADSLGNNTLIKMANAGYYNIQFSFQFQNSDNQLHDVSIWLRKNGQTTAADVAGSGGFVSVPNSHGGTPGHCIVAWNYFVQANANDYFQLVWSTNSAANVTMQFYAAGSPPPSSASAILTVNQVN
jgi:hypothetical protein